MKSAFFVLSLVFLRNCKVLINLCRVRRHEQLNLRPVTRGNSFVAKSGSHVLVSEGFAEMTSRAPAEKAVKSGQK